MYGELASIQSLNTFKTVYQSVAVERRQPFPKFSLQVFRLISILTVPGATGAPRAAGCGVRRQRRRVRGAPRRATALYSGRAAPAAPTAARRPSDWSNCYIFVAAG